MRNSVSKVLLPALAFMLLFSGGVELHAKSLDDLIAESKAEKQKQLEAEAEAERKRQEKAAAEAEAKRKAEEAAAEKARQQAAEEKRQKELAAKRKAEEAAAKKKAAEEAAAEAKRKADAEKARKVAEAKAAKERKLQEAAQKKAEAERQRRAEIALQKAAEEQRHQSQLVEINKLKEADNRGKGEKTRQINQHTNDLSDDRFPHQTGIYRGDGACNFSDPRCLYGLSFPSFNNYRDSGQGEGINDERYFFAVRNMGSDGNEESEYSNYIKAKPGDLLYFRAFHHNNGICNDATTVAKNVRLGINGFHSERDYFVSPPDVKVKVEYFIKSTNSIPRGVFDHVYVQSETGKPISIRFYFMANGMQITPSTVGSVKKQQDVMMGGALIGDISGCARDMFYSWTVMRVFEG